MPNNIRYWSNQTLKLAAWAVAVALAATGGSVHADELELPNAAEVQYFSPEAQQFYAAGVAALDKVDYSNAYSMLSKAASLQPAAIRVNHIAAKLALYQGRQHPADEARDFYETAINSYQNILRVPTITGDLRRQVTNEMKLAELERDALAQRDVLREAAGTSFIIDYNRKYGKAPERVAGTTVQEAPSTTLKEQLLAPLFAPTAQQGFTPGVGGGLGVPGAFPGAPGGIPGQPGGIPGQPGGIPGQPGAAPGQPF